MMKHISINNICKNDKKIAFFLCEKETTLFIDDFSKGKKVNPGKHSLSIIRHHDLFLDWHIDNELVEEYLVYPLLTDEESVVCIKSNEDITFQDEKEITSFEFTMFPVEFEIKEGKVNFTIECKKQSQLSMYFLKEKELPLNYKSITLYFENDYCKVYEDETIDGKFVKDSRKNLSLFKCNVNDINFFNIDLSNKTMNVRNKLLEKNYELNFLSNENYIMINETYMPHGKGIYLIK